MGNLYVGEKFECYTIEDPPREVKIPGITGIPAGEYRIIIDFSERFKRLMPLLLDVPDFEGIRIHAGNSAIDTSGCILVGMIEKEDHVEKSRVAFNRLFRKLVTANEQEKIWIEVIDP
jgi:hypothetical protein